MRVWRRGEPATPGLSRVGEIEEMSITMHAAVSICALQTDSARRRSIYGLPVTLVHEFVEQTLLSEGYHLGVPRHAVVLAGLA